LGFFRSSAVLAAVVCLSGLIGCESRPAIDRSRVLDWVQSDKVKGRTVSTTIQLKNESGRWISISTARLTETSSGLVARADDEILKTGFFVFPGAIRVTTIEEALGIAAASEGALYSESKR
jgi:hypothetical protein